MCYELSCYWAALWLLNPSIHSIYLSRPFTFNFASWYQRFPSLGSNTVVEVPRKSCLAGVPIASHPPSDRLHSIICIAANSLFYSHFFFLPFLFYNFFLELRVSETPSLLLMSRKSVCSEADTLGYAAARVSLRKCNEQCFPLAPNVCLLLPPSTLSFHTSASCNCMATMLLLRIRIYVWYKRSVVLCTSSQKCPFHFPAAHRVSTVPS